MGRTGRTHEDSPRRGVAREQSQKVRNQQQPKGEWVMNKMLQRRNRAGFTLVELAVVIIIIGVLAAFAVPRFLDSVERSKAAEAFNYLAAVRAAQERYQVRQGTYAVDLDDLDIQMPAPKYFTVGTPAAGGTSSLEDSWTLTLTRTGSAGC